jgi:hypothetical protein
LWDARRDWLGIDGRNARGKAVSCLIYGLILGSLAFRLPHAFRAIEWFVPLTGMVWALFGIHLTLKPLSGKDAIDLLCLALMILIPITMFIGTNNLLLSQASFFTGAWPLLFLIAPCAALGAKTRTPALYAILLLAAGLTGHVLHSGIVSPYRLDAPLLADLAPVSALEPLSGLELESERAAFLSRFSETMEAQGFRDGTPLLDLTGAHPGLVYAVGGVPPGISWIGGGYSFSLGLLRESMALMDETQHQNVWLLFAPGHHRGFSEDELRQAGIDLDRDFEQAATLPLPNLDVNLYVYRPKSLESER